jgi:predicted glycoside hydrolase/deacetylase ChbG (UPF0249 family)
MTDMASLKPKHLVVRQRQDEQGFTLRITPSVSTESVFVGMILRKRHFESDKLCAIQYIVNADDFGYSSSVNQAILLAFQDGLISSATLMANMPGFAEACEMSHQYGLERRLGIHLNISEGQPLTQAITAQRRFCDQDGMFANKLPRTTLRLKPEEVISLNQELNAQMQACLKDGIHPTHIDSHHHFHTVWPIGTITTRLAKSYAVPFVRLSRNIGPGISPPKRIYKMIFNNRLRLHRLTKTDFFGSADDIKSERSSLYGRIEVMVHPVLSSEGEVMEYREDGTSLRDVMEGLDMKDRMVTYWEC